MKLEQIMDDGARPSRATFRRQVLRVQWDTLEARIRDFRQSPLLAEWRSHFYPLLDGTPALWTGRLPR